MINYKDAYRALENLENLTEEKSRREEKWRKDIVEARKAGISYERIAVVAKCSSSKVRKICIEN